MPAPGREGPTGRAPAWQKREFERQQLRERLASRMHYRYDQSDGDSDIRGPNFFFFELARVALSFLASHGTQVLPQGLASDPISQAVGGFWKEMAAKVDVFSRSIAERDDILAEFLEKTLLPTAVASIRYEARKELMENPQLILRAEHSSDYVPFWAPEE